MAAPLITRLLATTAIGMAVVGIAGCASAQSVAEPDPVVRAVAVTEATVRNEANKAVLLLGADGQPNRIVGVGGLGGLELYDLSGRRTGAVPAGEVGSLDVRQGVTLGGRSMDLIVSTNTTDNTIRFFAAEGSGLTEVGARSVPLGFAVEGVCLLRNRADAALYAIVVGDGGEVDQLMVYADANGKIDARESRRLGLPSPTEHCVADDATGQVYLSEQTVGLWRIDGDPEADAAPRLIDAPRLGFITEELGGVALYDGGEGARYVIASDASSGRVFLYNRADEDVWAGAARVSGPDGAEVGEPGGLHSAGGMLLVTDEDAEGGANYKVVRVADLASAIGVPVGAPRGAADAPRPDVPTITARFETAPVISSGDAADDPAIWADPTNPANSLIVATDKKSGLYIYDMKGEVVQHLPDGKMNNIDLREGFMLGGRSIVLVTASDRTRKAIAIYELDTVNRRLINIADGVQPTEQGDPYGSCMYRSPTSGKTFVFINDSNGEKRQWELVDAGNGKVRAVRVRDFAFSSQVEGCVADDETGVLYVNEEDIGLWRLSAEPDGGTAMTSVQRVDENPALKDDMEGIGLYDLGDGRGYLVSSSQGNNTYAVYRREGDNEYIGSFAVVADGVSGVDGISETDGLEVTSRNLGPGFERGGMIAQDGRNVLPGELQNYKAVSWDDIARVLNLESR